MFQWFDEVRHGNLPDSAIGLMGGGRELPSISDLRALICVLNSARERLPALVARGHWAHRMLLVVDECHRANAAQARRIFDSRPKYTLGLSATPEQEVAAEDLPTDEAYEKSVVGQALGPIIYDFTIKQSLEAGLLTPFEVWHIGLPLSPTEANEHARLSREIADLRKLLQVRHRRSRTTQGFLAWCQTQASRGGPASAQAERFIGLSNRRKRLLYQAKARTDAVLGILSEETEDREGRTIVFHESIEEIESLFLRAAEMGLPAVLEHSQLPDSLRAENIDAFRRGIARVIISAKSLVEGFNVPSADLGVIAASSSSVRQTDPHRALVGHDSDLLCTATWSTVLSGANKNQRRLA
jgi:superfamily II DNA or RNA helicase